MTSKDPDNTISYKNQISTTYQIETGVLQGGIFSPILFNIYYPDKRQIQLPV